MRKIKRLTGGPHFTVFYSDLQIMLKTKLLVFKGYLPNLLSHSPVKELSLFSHYP